MRNSSTVRYQVWLALTVLSLGMTVRMARALAEAEPAKRKEITVAAQGGDYTTIQAAINAAPDFAVIRIAPGRYAENLEISKPLTLIGAGWTQTVIGPTEPSKPLSPVGRYILAKTRLA